MNQNIAVVGAGLAGKLLSLALVRAGWPVTLIDRGSLDSVREASANAAETNAAVLNSPPDGASDRRTTALSQSSVQVLDAMGLWSALAPTAQPVHAMRIGAGENIEQALAQSMHLDRQQAQRDSLAWIVENADLTASLDHALRTQGHSQRLLTLAANARVVDIEDRTCDGGKVCLDDGRTLWARLIVGCDGRRSQVRALVMNDISVMVDYRAGALVAVLRHTRPHQLTATQVFLPTGPMALLPMTPVTPNPNLDPTPKAGQADSGEAAAPSYQATEHHRSALIWSHSPQWTQAVMSLDPQQRLENLTLALEPILGSVTGVDSLDAFPLGATLSGQFSASGVALVGDAAHAIHPLAGQGFNLAIGDIHQLTQCLGQAALLGQAFGGSVMLDGYARPRQIEAQKLFTLTDALQRLYAPQNPLLAGLHKLGFPLLDKLPSVKAALVQAAIG